MLMCSAIAPRTVEMPDGSRVECYLYDENEGRRTA
jgi:hypothetical protein